MPERITVARLIYSDVSRADMVELFEREFTPHELAMELAQSVWDRRNERLWLQGRRPDGRGSKIAPD